MAMLRAASRMGMVHRHAARVQPLCLARAHIRSVVAQAERNGSGQQMELLLKDSTNQTQALGTQVKAELEKVDSNDIVGHLGRVDFAKSCEEAINAQINIEYMASYAYHALFAHFNADSVGLPGFAEFFRASSLEERSHAEMLMRYQNQRGGKVALQPVSLFNLDLGAQEYREKGDAMMGLEIALSLERLNFQKLRALHETAEKAGDGAMAGFVESEMLSEQSSDVKDAADRVARLRRIGKEGTGLYMFDKEMAEAAGEILAEANANYAKEI